MATVSVFLGRRTASLLWVRATLCGVAVWAAAPPPARAQAPPPCDSLLAEAEARYIGRAFAEAEERVRECLAHPDLGDEDALQAYRLLALVFLRQDDLAEARQAVVRLLGVSFAYEPDPVQDPPSYVALVGSVKEQLLVAQTAADSVRAEPPAVGPEIMIVRPPPSEVDPVAEREAPRRQRGLTRWLLIGGGALVAGTLGVLLMGGSSPETPAGTPLPPPPAFPR